MKNIYDEMILIICNSIMMLKETNKYGGLTTEELCMELGVEQNDFPKIIEKLEE